MGVCVGSKWCLRLHGRDAARGGRGVQRGEEASVANLKVSQLCKCCNCASVTMLQMLQCCKCYNAAHTTMLHTDTQHDAVQAAARRGTYSG